MAAAIPVRAGGTKKSLGHVVAWAIVDEDDADSLRSYRWTRTSDGYAARTAIVDGRKRTVLLHRQLLGLEHGDRRQGDHLNGDRLDCRRSNLRIADFVINGQNKRSFAGTSSQYRGVSWVPRMRRWTAYVTPNGKRTHLGYFADEIDAARVAAAARLAMMPGAVEKGGLLWLPSP